jgi:Ca2+-binding EF-hand superfamily protein
MNNAIIVAGLDKSNVARTLFMLADTNGNGKVEYNEIVGIWDKLGAKEKQLSEVKLDPSLIRVYFDKMDINKNGGIDLKEFRSLLNDKVAKFIQTNEQAKKLFS